MAIDSNTVVSLLQFDGANGSAVFTDSVPSMGNWTRVGSTQLSTSQKKFGTASLYFNGTSSWIEHSFTPGLDLIGNSFVIEGWVYMATGSDRRLFSTGGGGVYWDGNYGIHLLVQITPSGTLDVQLASGSSSPLRHTSTTAISNNQWSHIVVQFDASTNTLTLGVRGTLSHQVISGPYRPGTDPSATFGTIPGEGSSIPFTGYLDSFRISKGTTGGYVGSTYTVPTAAYNIPVAPVIGIAGAHRYWSFYVVTGYRNDYVYGYEIEFRNSQGDDLTTTSTSITTSSLYSGSYPVANLVDNNESTFFIGNNPTGHRVYVTFASAVEVAEFAYYNSQVNYGPKDIYVEYSDNGSTWTKASNTFTFSSGAGWQTIPVNQLPAGTDLTLTARQTVWSGNVTNIGISNNNACWTGINNTPLVIDTNALSVIPAGSSIKGIIVTVYAKRDPGDTVTVSVGNATPQNVLNSTTNQWLPFTFGSETNNLGFTSLSALQTINIDTTVVGAAVSIDYVTVRVMYTPPPIPVDSRYALALLHFDNSYIGTDEVQGVYWGYTTGKEPALSTTRKKLGDGSIFCSADGQSLSTTNSALLDLNTYDTFAIRVRVYPTRANSTNRIFVINGGSPYWGATSGYMHLCLSINSANKAEIIVAINGNTTGTLASAANVEQGAWNDIVVEYRRNTKQITLGLNGVVARSATTWDVYAPPGVTTAKIGHAQGESESYSFRGYIDEFFVTKAVEIVSGTGSYTVANSAYELYTDPNWPVLAKIYPHNYRNSDFPDVANLIGSSQQAISINRYLTQYTGTYANLMLCLQTIPTNAIITSVTIKIKARCSNNSFQELSWVSLDAGQIGGTVRNHQIKAALTTVTQTISSVIPPSTLSAFTNAQLRNPAFETNVVFNTLANGTVTIYFEGYWWEVEYTLPKTANAIFFGNNF